MLVQGYFAYARKPIVRDVPLFSDDVLEKELHFDAIDNQKMVLFAAKAFLI